MGIFQFLGLTVEVIQWYKKKMSFSQKGKHELALLVMYTEFAC